MLSLPGRSSCGRLLFRAIYVCLVDRRCDLLLHDRRRDRCTRVWFCRILHLLAVPVGWSDDVGVGSHMLWSLGTLVKISLRLEDVDAR